tara:strand:- start:1021 stop:1296 length:276 start_codon:yes stop_codon:yes gene_type:complete
MFNIEDTLNELEGGFKEINKMQFSILEATLDTFDFIYQDVGDKRLYETMSREEKDKLIAPLKEELLPLFKENKFEKGIEKANSLIKDLSNG